MPEEKDSAITATLPFQANQIAKPSYRTSTLAIFSLSAIGLRLPEPLPPNHHVLISELSYHQTGIFQVLRVLKIFG